MSTKTLLGNCDLGDIVRLDRHPDRPIFAIMSAADGFGGFLAEPPSPGCFGRGWVVRRVDPIVREFSPREPVTLLHQMSVGDLVYDALSKLAPEPIIGGREPLQA